MAPLEKAGPCGSGLLSQEERFFSWPGITQAFGQGFPGNFLTICSVLIVSLSEYGAVATSPGELMGNRPTVFLSGTEVPDLYFDFHSVSGD